MGERPTVHLTNWSSRNLHGPGRRFTIMAKPRKWERGAGSVDVLMPESDDLDAVRLGHIDIDEYRRRFRVGLERKADGLPPGHLWLKLNNGRGYDNVEDGDTLCCACSRADAAAGRCHRVWAAQALAAAGWRVVLDGEEVSDG